MAQDLDQTQHLQELVSVNRSHAENVRRTELKNGIDAAQTKIRGTTEGIGEQWMKFASQGLQALVTVPAAQQALKPLAPLLGLVGLFGDSARKAFGLAETEVTHSEYSDQLKAHMAMRQGTQSEQAQAMDASATHIPTTKSTISGPGIHFTN